MKILGIHAPFTAHTHDPSACLVIDGTVVAAVEEERINRNKTSHGCFPERAIKAVLQTAGLQLGNIDVLAADGVSYTALGEKISRYVNHFFKTCPKIELVHHAHAHAAGGFYSSGFESSLVVSVDGSGDGLSVLIYDANRKTNQSREWYRLAWPESLGAFYTAFTNYLGYRSIEGEYKMMGMAAFGEPRFDLSQLLSFDDSNGSVHFDTRMWDGRFHSSVMEPNCVDGFIKEVTGVERADFESKTPKQEHFDLAASVQKQFCEVYVGMLKHYLRKSGQRSLTISGGCALNCLANKELLELDLDGVYVQPGASDRGLSFGSALYTANKHGDSPKPVKNMYLGREFSDTAVLEAVKLSSLPYTIVPDVSRAAAVAVTSGKVIGWFQGRSEFGPRALGHRSILACASVAGMKDKLNEKIKFREPFRPFAPSMLLEDFRRILPYRGEFPYMTFTFDIPESFRSQMCEAVQVDGTARIQTVNETDCPKYYRLLKHIQESGGLGVVLNTSFNLAGEPIVDSPTDAIRTFVSSGIDELYINNICVSKHKS